MKAAEERRHSEEEEGKEEEEEEKSVLRACVCTRGTSFLLCVLCDVVDR